MEQVLPILSVELGKNLRTNGATMLA